MTTLTSASTARLVARNNATRLNMASRVDRRRRGLPSKVWQPAFKFKCDATSPSAHSSSVTRSYRGRFASRRPAPLHSARWSRRSGSWLLRARAPAARWLVRIEDSIRRAKSPGAADAHAATLAAFGLVSDAPVDAAERRAATPTHARSARLLAAGACVTNASAAAATWRRGGGVHPRRCVRRADARATPAMPLARRRRADVAFDDAIQGRVAQDVGARRRRFRRCVAPTACWAYQLAVVVDDAAQGITDVVRGADLLDSTPRQILLQRALGLPHAALRAPAAGRRCAKAASCRNR